MGQDNHIQPLFYAHPKKEERREKREGEREKKKCEIERKKELYRPNSSQGEKKEKRVISAGPQKLRDRGGYA